MPKPELFEQTNSLAVVEQPTAMQPIQPTAFTVLQMAVSNGAGIDVIERLIAATERIEANEARKAFFAALAAFKKNPPRLQKNKEVDFTGKTGIRTHYKHATLDYVADEIGKALAIHGLSFRWQTEQTSRIKVTCILQHEKGHSESLALEAPQDESGNKNPIQMVGSTVTYLERYTLLAITGMATGEDTDGRTHVDAGRQMDENAFLDWIDAITQAPDQDSLKKMYFQALEAAKKVGDKGAEAKFGEAKNAWFKSQKGAK